MLSGNLLTISFPPPEYTQKRSSIYVCVCECGELLYFLFISSSSPVYSCVSALSLPAFFFNTHILFFSIPLPLPVLFLSPLTLFSLPLSSFTLLLLHSLSLLFLTLSYAFLHIPCPCLLSNFLFPYIPFFYPHPLYLFPFLLFSLLSFTVFPSPHSFLSLSSNLFFPPLSLLLLLLSSPLSFFSSPSSIKVFPLISCSTAFPLSRQCVCVFVCPSIHPL